MIDSIVNAKGIFFVIFLYNFVHFPSVKLYEAALDNNHERIRETAKIKEGEERTKHHFSKAAQQYVCKLVVVMMGLISELVKHNSDHG